MQHLEEIRSIIIKLGLAIAALAYLRMIAKAFGRSALWGIFSLFGPPIGGWLHCLSTWWDMSRTFVVHVVALAAVAYGLFFFPREPLYGYWTDTSGNVVFNFQENGTLRDYSLKPDGKFSFRGAKLLTIELAVPSKTRLAISKDGEYHVAYYAPKDGTITLYHQMRDPEVFFSPTAKNQDGLELHRVPNIAEADFKKKLDRWALREGVYDTAVRLLAAVDKGAVADLPDTTLLPRYERYMALARSASVADLEKLSPIEQVHALRLRALYAREIAAGATAASLVASDLKRDYFMLQPYARARVTDVTIEPSLKKGSALVVANQRMGIIRSLPATVTETGTWNIAVLDQRDADIAAMTNIPSGKPRQLASAYSYLERRLAIGEQTQLAQPLAP